MATNGTAAALGPRGAGRVPGPDASFAQQRLVELPATRPLGREVVRQAELAQEAQVVVRTATRRLRDRRRVHELGQHLLRP